VADVLVVFVIPVVALNGHLRWWEAIIALMLFSRVLSGAWVSAVVAVAALYSIKLDKISRVAIAFLSLQNAWIFRGGRLRSRSPRKTAIAASIASYLLTIYWFALAFAFLSHFDERAFNVALPLPTALYFSVVTIATVGFGDVLALSATARALVVAEILTGLMYAVFVFAGIVGVARVPRDREPDERSGESDHRS
jgi:voltage-gated potassium channel Kch